jgi:3-dehydroquinate dehydratase
VIYQYEQSTSGNDEEIDIDLEENQNDSDGVKNSMSCEPNPNLFPISTENHQSGRLKAPEESLILKEYSLLFQPSPIQNEEWIEIVPNSQIRAIFSRNSLLFAPNSLESQENVGRWGERFVFHYLNQITPLCSNNQKSSLTSACSSSSSSSSSFVIDWINEKEESNAFYDLIIKEKTFSTRSGGAQDISFAEKLIFIEVKTTSMDSRKNVFQISWNEFQFAMKSPKVPYYIFRVYSAKDLEKISIVILKDIPKLIEAGRVQLCLAT